MYFTLTRFPRAYTPTVSILPLTECLCNIFQLHAEYYLCVCVALASPHCQPECPFGGRRQSQHRHSVNATPLTGRQWQVCRCNHLQV